MSEQIPPSQSSPSWPSVPVPAGSVVPEPAAPGPAVPVPGQPADTPVPAPNTSVMAIVALVLAVASFALCPLLPAIASLILAHLADQEIRGSNGAIQGQGLSTAAKIVSWVNIGISVAVSIIALVVLVFIVASGNAHSTN